MGNDISNYLEQHFQLKDKNILITGAANGLGYEISKCLAFFGARLFLLDKDEKLTSFSEDLRADGSDITSYIVDLADAESVDTAVGEILNKIEKVDVLINDAGINYVNDFVDLKWEQSSEIIDVNLKSMLYMTHKILPNMRGSGGGKIINIASRAATVPMRNNAVYAATKNAILAFTRQTAIENAEFSIFCNAISPGLIKTNMNKNTRNNEKALNTYLSRQSIKRLGEPGDIANTVLFLISTLSDFITGQDIIVDGGYF